MSIKSSPLATKTILLIIIIITNTIFITIILLYSPKKKFFPRATIIYPVEDKEIREYPFTAKGTLNSPIPDGWHLWLLHSPDKSKNSWYPQGGEIYPDLLNWEGRIWLGSRDDKIDKQYNIQLVLVNHIGNIRFRNYLADSKRSGQYKMISKPKNTKVLAETTVTRKTNQGK